MLIMNKIVFYRLAYSQNVNLNCCLVMVLLGYRLNQLNKKWYIKNIL
jgi:hypothetical protein